MRQAVVAWVSLALFATSWPTAMTAPVPPQEPVIAYPTGTSIVTLDFVVRDKRGRSRT